MGQHILTHRQHQTFYPTTDVLIPDAFLFVIEILGLFTLLLSKTVGKPEFMLRIEEQAFLHPQRADS